ncbi:LptF/LptG family permease [Mesonia sp. HuA40]|uniref:LptF/LptG family permease n=1 Tax=Mesonia sp. HuA40 TaxID=2602761 RepID=UPI0011C74420|nr:LptF/LptG family permease [Mesonia sp. HuA40]TXK70885.1 YjgP/YjgQ family permease [Mesonia sp. HuA40]
MKILDRYIFTSFVQTFFAVFVVLMFIFVLQGIWLHISELAGKDLDYFVIGRFLFYIMPKVIPLVLPLTILVTSIMTFGSFAENYEFAAMKSSGISLQRAMRSLIYFIGLLSIIAFFFANNVIPWAEFKSINLRKNISKLKPAMAIVEGAFNDIGDVNIKVTEKSGDNDQYLRDVIIHKKNQNNRGNFTVIKAKRGELASSEDSDFLSLILFEGNYYDEIQPNDFKERQRKPFVKSYFDTYTINIDLSNFNDVDLNEEKYNYSYKMLDSQELRVALDSLSADYNQEKINFNTNIINRSGVQAYSDNFGVRKTTASTLKNTKGLEVKQTDTLSYQIDSLEDLYASYNPTETQQILNIAIGTARGSLSSIKGKKNILRRKSTRINKTEIQLHSKFALAVSCFILFFVGAPLGAIIRKGGLGLPMVVAILLFLTYHFIGIFATNSAENGAISPFLASWLSTFIMMPLSIYLTYRATTDQGFINTDAIVLPIKRLSAKLGLTRKPKK